MHKKISYLLWKLFSAVAILKETGYMEDKDMTKAERLGLNQLSFCCEEASKMQYDIY